VSLVKLTELVVSLVDLINIGCVLGYIGDEWYYGKLVVYLVMLVVIGCVLGYLVMLVVYWLFIGQKKLVVYWGNA
jgi:hypothetical protein